MFLSRKSVIFIGGLPFQAIDPGADKRKTTDAKYIRGI